MAKKPSGSAMVFGGMRSTGEMPEEMRRPNPMKKKKRAKRGTKRKGGTTTAFQGGDDFRNY